MERDGDQGPDAASIKPVSSLRARFENIQNSKSTPEQEHIAPALKAPPTPTGLKPAEPSKQPGFIRASLDLPRPRSPWSAQQVESRQNAARTPVAPRGGSESPNRSPTRSNHKRPMSMLIGSSPKLTPAVQVDSPKSPPRGQFARPKSRSPERVIGKVRDLVSQHSSRSSTRAPTPGDTSQPGTPADIAANPKPFVFPQRPKSPIPPPVNRAEKPKIPAKPPNITATPDTNLSTKPLAFLSERRVSPFNTPPSSDEEHALEDNLPVQPRPRPSQDLSDRPSEPLQIPQSTTRNTPPPVDARALGFSSTRAPAERTDPRSLGFAAAQPPLQPALENRVSPQPTRAETNQRAGPAKDPRALGFGASTPAPQQPSLPPQTQRGSPPRKLPPVQADKARDARQYGLSTTGSIPSTPLEARGSNPEQRAVPKVPPPRPSETSKRPTYAPGIARTATSAAAPRTPGTSSVTPGARRSEDVPRQVIPMTSDVKFPPPPKRGTFNEASGSNLDSLDVPTPTLPRRRSFDVNAHRDEDSDDVEDPEPEPTTTRHDYPDGSQANRRPPLLDPSKWQYHTKTDGRVFDICGKLLCSASYHTRLFDLEAGEELLDLNHGETVKTTAVIFKPGADIKAEGKRIWIGNNIGDLQEIDLETHVTIDKSTVHNRVEIVRILRHHRDLWTIDESGKVFVWHADRDTGIPSLKNTPVSHKLHSKPTYAMAVQDTLWVATGKEIRIYRPGRESTFNVTKGPVQVVPGVSDVTCGTFSEDQGKVYLGHADGKVTMYSLKDYSCLGSMKVSDYKINAMTIIGDRLWAVYKTGKVYVYDTSTTPWKIQKDWKAHQGPATGILSDPSSVYLLGRQQVVTTGHDQYVRLWDGMLEEDWVESTMHARDTEYCTFRDVRASVTSWNCGATNPFMLRTDFIADAVHANEPNPPEILVFGFQEVVDLEDRGRTAKSLLGFAKKKEARPTEHQHQSRVYRDWRDYLSKCVNRYLPQHEYTEIHTSSLIGLFQCVFVRTNERRNITSSTGSEVKCGMGGHYGNKGALLSRFILDSSSLCFINCHLAAGQSNSSHRNNDVATILESENLPAEHNLDMRSSLFVGGGDGKQILDHEICILNGDLNYRIDTMPRPIVIKHIENNNLSALLERDQLNVSRRRIAGFRLAPFTELPITFPPTYKYDVGSDRYDTSEKKRSPAWCDRLLFRSASNRCKQLTYQRHEGVTYSDHRPVSGLFKIQIKKVDEVKRKAVLKSVYADFEKMRKQMLEDGCVRYLVGSFGIEREEARRLIRGAK